MTKHTDRIVYGYVVLAVLIAIVLAVSEPSVALGIIVALGAMYAIGTGIEYIQNRGKA